MTDRNAQIERLTATLHTLLCFLERRGHDVSLLHHRAAAHVWSDRRGGRTTAIRTGLTLCRERP